MGGTPAEAPPSSSPPAPHLRALGARGCVCYGIKRRWDAAGEDQPGYGGWGGLWVGGIWGGCGENGDPRRDRASPLRSPMEPVIPSISRSLPVPPPTQISARVPICPPRSSCVLPFVSQPRSHLLLPH